MDTHGDGAASVVVPRVVEVTALLERLAADLGVPVALERPAHGVSVVAEPWHLRLVLRTLIENAVVHGRPPVDVHVELRGPQVAVMVCDDGDGIPDDVLPTMFEAFVDMSATAPRMGLGLHVAQRLAELNDGELRHVTRVGGACFELVLRSAGPWGGVVTDRRQRRAVPGFVPGGPRHGRRR